MRILIAPDSFGGTLSSAEAAAAIAAGWARSAPDDTTVQRPLSDGGPGFVDTLATSIDGTLISVPVTGPLGRPAPGAVLLATDGTAYIESAQATGLHLLTPEERDPRVTSSYGVGILMLAAVEAGARRLVIGLGGSATNDAGAGMLAAVGVDPLDETGAALPPGGAALLGLDRLDGVPHLRQVEIVLASDVDNPLVGLHGASAVFGPQKGADTETVLLLDAALARFAEVAQRDLPSAPAGLATVPGGGAAGGLGAALIALGAHRVSGITLVRESIRLDAALETVDLVVTGEGSFDDQSLRGKVAIGVAAAAQERGVPCLVLAGQVKVGRRQAAAAGVDATYSVAEHAGSVEEAMARPAQLLTDLAAAVAAEWGSSRSA